MLGLMRQEIIFARRQKELGQPPGWISVPLIVTSPPGRTARTSSHTRTRPLAKHCWGDVGHRACCSRWMKTRRPPRCERSTPAGAKWLCVVVSKRDTPNHFSAAAAQSLIEHGSSPCSRRSVHRTTAVRGDWRLPVGGSAQSPCPPGAPWACVVRHRGGRTRPSAHSATNFEAAFVLGDEAPAKRSSRLTCRAC